VLYDAPEHFGWCLTYNVKVGTYVQALYLACWLFRRTLLQSAPGFPAGVRCEARLKSEKWRALRRPAGYGLLS
jgi:hypothetical protein